MSAFISQIDTSEASRTYKVILSHAAEIEPGPKTDGIYTFDLPPILDNTNDTNFNQCFISLRKVYLDPTSIDVNNGAGISMRNPNPVWTSGDPASSRIKVGQVIMEMNVPSKQTASFQKRETTPGGPLTDYNQLYKWQELVGLTKMETTDFLGEGSGEQTLAITLPNLAFDTGPMACTNFDIGKLNTSGTRTQTTALGGSTVFFVDNGEDVMMPGSIDETGNLLTTGGMETIHTTGPGAVKGSFTIDNANAGVLTPAGNATGTITSSHTGNHFYYGYECKDPQPVLCANPFGSQLTINFKDPYFGRANIWMCDLATAATTTRDITNVTAEFIITMVGNKAVNPRN